MTENRLTSLVYVLMVLVSVNLALSAYLVLRPAGGGTQGTEAKTFPDDKVKALAKLTVDLYNRKDSATLYENFDEFARVQFSQQMLAEQVAKLHTIVGSVDDFAFSHSQVAGRQDGKEFWALIYKVRLKGGPFSAGEL